jgi:uncharacterized membrane protein
MVRATKSDQTKTTNDAGKMVGGETNNHIDGYHRLELGEIFTRLRELSNQRLQVYTLIATAYLFVLGLAINNQKIGLFIITIFLLIALVIVDNRIKRIEGAVELRALELENKYAPDPDAALLHMTISVAHHSSEWIEKLDAINAVKEPDKRNAALRKTRRGLANSVLLPLAILIEVAIAFGLWFAGWELF